MILLGGISRMATVTFLRYGAFFRPYKPWVGNAHVHPPARGAMFWPSESFTEQLKSDAPRTAVELLQLVLVFGSMVGMFAGLCLGDNDGQAAEVEETARRFDAIRNSLI